jgi:chemotaxis protein methyltransferase CheR
MMSGWGLDLEIRPEDFDKFCRFIHGRCGINLHEGKRDLVRSRLAKRLRALQMSSYKQYFDYIFSDRDDQEIVFLLDAISTNVTYFFREEKHFSFLRERVLPEIGAQIKAGSRTRIRFWSAGCSSGEEPYSLAIILRESLPPKPCDIKILATDLSTKALQQARNGIYSRDKLKNVPPEMLKRYFQSHPDGSCQVAPAVREMITFARLNLMYSFPFHGLFEVIFCRNVMIYFDKSTQETLVQKFSRFLQPGGYLMIGHSESLTSIDHDLLYVQPAVYQKRR